VVGSVASFARFPLRSPHRLVCHSGRIGFVSRIRRPPLRAHRPRSARDRTHRT
jgi:hypothetical protein